MNVPDYDRLEGSAVTNDLGEKLGVVVGLFIDDASSTPTWVAVRSGLFGRHHSLIPLAESRWSSGHLLVPYTSDDIASAPHSDPDIPLDAEQERELFAHYNVGYSDKDRPSPRTGVDAEDTGLTGTLEAGSHPIEFGTDDVDATRTAGVPGLPTTGQTLRLRRFN